MQNNSTHIQTPANKNVNLEDVAARVAQKRVELVEIFLKYKETKYFKDWILWEHFYDVFSLEKFPYDNSKVPEFKSKSRFVANVSVFFCFMFSGNHL